MFLRKKIPVSHRARGETPTISLALGANRESKERVKDKRSRIHSSRIRSGLVYARRNAQHLELRLPESTRFVLITLVMVTVSASGLTGCLLIVSPPPLSFQNIQSHEKSLTSHSARGETQAMSPALGTIREGKKRVKGKARRIHSNSRMGSALECVRRNTQYHELQFPESTWFVLITVVMVTVSPSGPTGCLLKASPPPLSSHNMQSHEKIPASHRALGETPTIRMGANREGKERVKGKASRINSSRIWSALVYVRRNACELKLPESTRFVLTTVVMVVVPSNGLCVVFVFNKLHTTAQSGPVTLLIIIILCHSQCVCVCVSVCVRVCLYFSNYTQRIIAQSGLAILAILYYSY